MDFITRLLLLPTALSVLFLLLALREGRAEGCIWLMFPLVWGIPLMLAGALIFAPVEWYLDGRGLGHVKNAAVPLSGALAVLVILAFRAGRMRAASRATDRLSQWIARKPWVLFGWAGLGAAAGVLWRLTDWVTP